MTQQQPPEPHSHRAQYQRFKHLFHLITDRQKHRLRKGVMIHGASGVDKTVGVEAVLVTKER